MPDPNLEYLINSIHVTGSSKAWSSNPGNGTAGGTEVSYDVVPANPNQVGWTKEEAGVVVFDVRYNIHVLLLADAQKRKVALPDGAQQTLVEYREQVERLKGQLGERVRWAEAATPPPETPGTDIP